MQSTDMQTTLEVEQDIQTVVPNAPNGKKKEQTMDSRKKQQTIFIIALLAVPILYWIFEWIYINASAIFMAFQDKQGNFTLGNFNEVWNMLFNPGKNSILPRAFLNTISTFCASEFIGVPISMVVSYFIYKQIKGYKIYRIIFYLPHIISSMVLVTAFKAFVSGNGPLGTICDLLKIALPEEGLLKSPTAATPTVITYYLWTACCGNILFYSAMGRIPPELIEVGKLEGLSLFKELIYVVLPLIWPTFATTLVLDCCNLLSAGGPVLLFGNEAFTYGKVHTLPYWFFSQVYSDGINGLGNYGVMSCVGLCLTAISVPFTLIIRGLLNKVPTAEF